MPNITMGTSRARLNDLKSQRAGILENAETQLNLGNTQEYKSLLAKAQAMNQEIEDLSSLVREYDRYDIKHAPQLGNDAYDLKNMGEMLMAGERVGFKPDMVRTALVTNAATVFSGELVAPVGGTAQVNDGFRAQVSSMIDQVRVETFDGLFGWEEPYLATMPTAVHGKATKVGGTTRAESSPVWKKAKLLAHEVSTTAFMDRNITQLSPVDYAARCQAYALKALRKAVNDLIFNGDGDAQSEVFGLTTGKNTDGESIFATSSVNAISSGTLSALVFGYGGDEETAANARLFLSKENLAKFGALTIGDGDNRPLYDISANGNTGTIKSGGLIVPYTITSAAGANTLAYGDPLAYLLALFGSYTVRVDESVKSVERMVAILGDVMMGGNLTVDKGMLIATLT